MVRTGVVERPGRFFGTVIVIIFGIGLVLEWSQLAYHAFIASWWAEAAHAEAGLEPIFQSVQKLGEALIIAGILALVVDRYAKMRLVEDVGEEIARKVYGYHLPPKLREQLQHINSFNLIARDLEWTIRMKESTVEEGALLYWWTLEYAIENVSAAPQEYRHRTSSTVQHLDNLPTIEILQVAHRINGNVDRSGRDGSYCYSGTDAGFAETCTIDKVKNSVSWTNPTPIFIPPSDPKTGRSEKHTFMSIIQKTVSLGEIRQIALKYPTIGFTLQIDPAPGFDVFTSFDIEGAPGTLIPGTDTIEWKLDGALLHNQKIWVKHGRIDPAQSVPATAVEPKPAGRELAEPVAANGST